MLIRFSPLRVCSVPWMQGLDADDWSMNVKAESFIIDSENSWAFSSSVGYMDSL